MERISGEDFDEHVSASNAPVDRPADPPSQFEFGAEDKHNLRGRSDERIKLAVMTTLHWDLTVPCDRVQVSVDRGWVTLTGQVLRAYEKSRAEADARMTPGVAGVTNEITCQSRD
jgi:osmotically-inducible protein OsmY